MSDETDQSETDPLGFLTSNPAEGCKTFRETPGAVRFRRGGDMGHPERILQQQFTIEEYAEGYFIGGRTEWRDVPWLDWGEDEQ